MEIVYILLTFLEVDNTLEPKYQDIYINLFLREKRQCTWPLYGMMRNQRPESEKIYLTFHLSSFKEGFFNNFVFPNVFCRCAARFHGSLLGKSLHLVLAEIKNVFVESGEHLIIVEH